MSKSKISQAMVLMRSKIKAVKEPGYTEGGRNKYFNPLLTPPPRYPQTPEDFRRPEELGHWQSLGFDWTNPVKDRYQMHEMLFGCFFLCGYTIWLWLYAPDYKLRDWARREAYLRTCKREALGLPLVDKDFIDPDRIILPSEEELNGFPVYM